MPFSGQVEDERLETKFHAQYIRHIYNSPGEGGQCSRLRETWYPKSTIAKSRYTTVRLEKRGSRPIDHNRPRLRVLKTIQLPGYSEIDYSRELKAVIKFSRPKYIPWFVRSFGWFAGENLNSICIAMEYLPLGDLQGHIHAPVPETEIQIIFAQLLEGLRHMHLNGFAHRDIKLKNILVAKSSPDWHVKICDFGITKKIKEGTPNDSTICGTPGFIAPEMLGLLAAEGAPYAMDMWSLGAVVYFLATFNHLISSTTMLRDFVVQKHSPPFKELERTISGPGVDMITALLRIDPSSRPTAEEAKTHPWIAASYQDSSGPSTTSTNSGLQKVTTNERLNWSSNSSQPSTAWSSTNGTDRKRRRCDDFIEHLPNYPIIDHDNASFETTGRGDIGQDLHWRINFAGPSRHIPTPEVTINQPFGMSGKAQGKLPEVTRTSKLLPDAQQSQVHELVQWNAGSSIFTVSEDVSENPWEGMTGNAPQEVQETINSVDINDDCGIGINRTSLDVQTPPGSSSDSRVLLEPIATENRGTGTQRIGNSSAESFNQVAISRPSCAECGKTRHVRQLSGCYETCDRLCTLCITNRFEKAMCLSSTEPPRCPSGCIIPWSESTRSWQSAIVREYYTKLLEMKRKNDKDECCCEGSATRAKVKRNRRRRSCHTCGKKYCYHCLERLEGKETSRHLDKHGRCPLEVAQNTLELKYGYQLPLHQ